MTCATPAPEPAFGRHILSGGYVLTLNSLMTAALGFAFWVVAARRFTPGEVGFSSAGVAGAAVVGGIAADGLHNAFLRFLPRVGRSWGAVVVRGYVAAAASSAALAVLFVVIVGRLDHSLHPLEHSGWFLLYVAGAPFWTIFSLQDVVLIARRRAGLVLVENTVVSLARIALLLAPAVGSHARWIFIAWLAPVIPAALVVNAVLAFHAQRGHGAGSFVRARVAQREMSRYYLVATVGSVAGVLMMSLMPVLVAGVSGVAANARFYLPWAIATSLQLLSSSMASPLAAEIARGLDDERREVRRVLRHCVAGVTAVAVPLFFIVPPVLARLGSGYRVERSLFALLLGAAVVNAIATVYLARARAGGDVKGAAIAQWSAAITLVGGSAVLLPGVGLLAVGVAALAAQCVSAVIAISRDAGDDIPRGSRTISATTASISP
jgi:O-antigen/teichoic acid export membrane protein